MPASDTSAIRSPASSRGSSSAVRAASLCSWYERTRASIPCRSSSVARVARVLAEDDVGRAQLREHAQRDVVEVADRRRADGERHGYDASSVSKATNPAPMSPAVVPSSARTTSHLVAHRARAPRGAAPPRAPARSGASHAATPKPPPMTISSRLEDVRERAHAGAEVPADVGEDRARLSRRPRSRAARAGARPRPGRTPPAPPAWPRAPSRTARGARVPCSAPGTAGRRGR